MATELTGHGRARLLILEPDERTALGWTLSLAGLVEVDWITTRETALRALVQARWCAAPYDFVLFDVLLRDGGAWDLLPRLCALTPPAAVALVSSVIDAATCISAYRFGALAVVKPIEPQQIVELIELLSRRSKNANLRAFGQSFKLSRCELEVLALDLAGLDRKQVADRLGRSVSTVKTHWDRIRYKTRESTQRDVVRRYVEFCERGSEARYSRLRPLASERRQRSRSSWTGG